MTFMFVFVVFQSVSLDSALVLNTESEDSRLVAYLVIGESYIKLY